MGQAVVCHIISSIGFLILSFIEVDPWQHIAIDLIPVAQTGTKLCFLLIYVDIFFIYRNPFNPYRHRGTVQGLAIAAAVGLQFPWHTLIMERRSTAMDVLGIFLWFDFLPMLLFVAVGAFCNGTVQLLVHLTKRGSRPASISFLARQRVMRHGTSYLMLHTVEVLLGVALVVVAQYYDRRPWLWHTMISFTVSRPAFFFAWWLVVNGYMGFAGSAAAAAPVALAKRGSAKPSPKKQDVPGSLGGGIELGSLPGADDASPSPGASAADAEKPNGPQKALVAARAEVEYGSFMEELRFELIYDVAYSIGDYAQRELLEAQQAQQKCPRSTYHGGTSSPKLHGGRITQTTTGPSSGVSFSVDQARTSRAKMPQGPERNSTAASSRLSQSQVQYNQSTGLLHSAAQDSAPLARSSTFNQNETGRRGARHYSTEIFRGIREAFGVSQAAYARDFPHRLTEVDTRWKERLKESVSEGASGSFFYRVVSRRQGESVASRFIVKQITREEYMQLMEILPAYAEYVKERKGKSLIQYFSCHSIPLRWRYSGAVYFVVMRNFLPVAPWLVFDLKGATANRRGIKKANLHLKSEGSENKYGTLRDWEWMDVAMSIDVSPDDRAQLASMIAADAAFLGSQGQLDYSLLVGIHRLSRDISSAEREALIPELTAAGGYLSTDRRKVYFFGVIDALERFKLGWQCQYSVLTCAYYMACKGNKADGISALRPRDYADRFVTFMNSEVLHIQNSLNTSSHMDLSPSKTWGRKASSGLARWARLWQKRRRGLIKDRIEVERSDFLDRISELEQGQSAPPSSPSLPSPSAAL